MSNYWPAGTVYGTLLNFQAEWDAMAAQMTQAPYKAPPKAPVLFVKTANTWSASGSPVPVPARVPQVEVGAAIAMVMGSNRPESRNRKAYTAINNIAHIVLMNDLSTPHTSFFRPPVKFKCLDGFLGIGSNTLNAAQAGDPSKFLLEVRINGELAQSIDFSRMVRGAAELLRDVGEFMTLREGDVLMLGSDCLPGGGKPLARVGDNIEICSPSHPALGILSNTLVGEAT